MRNVKSNPVRKIVIDITGYTPFEAGVIFETTLLKPLADGEYIVPSTLPDDGEEFKKWEDRFLMCQAALIGISSFAFLEIVRVKDGVEYWEFGT